MDDFNDAYKKVMSSLFTADDARDLQATKHKKAFADLIEGNKEVLDPILEQIKQAASESKNTRSLVIKIDPSKTNYHTILKILEYLGYKITDSRTKSNGISCIHEGTKIVLMIDCAW